MPCCGYFALSLLLVLCIVIAVGTTVGSQTPILKRYHGVIWLTQRPSHTRQHTTTICVCYIPPESSISVQQSDRLAQMRFQALTQRLMSATLQGHALLAGDFNARVGNLPDPWVTDVGHGVPPQLLNTDNTINSHGRKLVRLCEDSAMILCTGRTLGDLPALPSFKARTNTVASRLDHVLVDPDLFSSIQSCCIGPIRDDSDHMPLEMRILLSAAAPLSPPPTYATSHPNLDLGWSQAGAIRPCPSGGAMPG